MSKRNREKRTPVRGNTANYTPEKPLFGKYVGSVYRPDHERGIADNIENITINKDIDVDRQEKTKSIYLAGKIHHRDWRHNIVKGLRNVYRGDCSGDIINCSTPQTWPILPKAVFGLDYTGPYFIGDDHGCCHGNNSHGVAASNEELYDGPHGNFLRRDMVTDWCLQAIHQSDIFFAWIEDTTCYGTLAEIGFARALGKTIWIASTKTYLRHTDLWFACNLATGLLLEEWLSPSLALQILIAKDLYKRSIAEAFASSFAKEHTTH